MGPNKGLKQAIWGPMGRKEKLMEKKNIKLLLTIISEMMLIQLVVPAEFYCSVNGAACYKSCSLSFFACAPDSKFGF